MLEQTATPSSVKDKRLHGQASRPHLEEVNLLPGVVAPRNSPGNNIILP